MTSVVNTIKQLRYKRASILRDMKGIKQSLEDGVNVPDWVRSDSLRKMSSEVTRLTHCIEQTDEYPHIQTVTKQELKELLK